MTKILIGFFTALLFIGCSSQAVEKDVEAKLVVGSSLQGMQLNDQNEKAHTVPAGTQTVIFAFSKDSAHTCNDYFNTKAPTYLEDNKAVFVADVSAAPSLIRSMFIMPGLKDFKHTVLVLEDKTTAADYRAGVDTEKIIVVNVNVNNLTIESINNVDTLEQLVASVEK